MGSVQLDVEGGICMVCLFPVEHMHLHLVVVTLNRKHTTELMFDPPLDCVQ